MPIDKFVKLRKRIERLGKYALVLLHYKKEGFPTPLNDFVLSAVERGKYLPWILNKINKLTRYFIIYHGHDENSKRYWGIYYKFTGDLFNSSVENFKKGLERDKIKN